MSKIHIYIFKLDSEMKTFKPIFHQNSNAFALRCRVGLDPNASMCVADSNKLVSKNPHGPNARPIESGGIWSHVVPIALWFTLGIMLLSCYFHVVCALFIRDGYMNLPNMKECLVEYGLYTIQDLQCSKLRFYSVLHPGTQVHKTCTWQFVHALT